MSADYKFYFCENNLPTSATAIPDAISVTRARGNKIFFARNGNNWQSDLNTNDRLVAQYNTDSTAITGWTFTNSSSDDVEQYDAKGRLISITKRNGVVQKLTYSDGTTNDTSVARLPVDAPACTKTSAGAVLARGKLLCVTDNWNHQMNFAYDAKGRINSVIDAAGGQYQYAYDGATGGCNTDPNSYACAANNLTSVTYPDNKTRSYVYNEASNINGGTACPYGSPVGSGLGTLPNALTGIIDENGKRYASWTYDCYGRATSSEHAGGVEKVALTYGDPDANGSKATTVDTYLGTTTNPQKVSNTFQFKALLNTISHTALNQPCINCDNTSNKTYDANGNLSRKTDFNGTITTYEYNLSRNLETKRVEASDTAQAQTTTTTWHASYRLPMQVNAPLLRTSYTYDSKGNVLTKIEQATSDADGSQGASAVTTGSPRTWTYTYNNAGQVLSIKGPRTDVLDKTTYIYDTQGNLTSITNAAGHVTTLGNYDGNGRAGQITDANGIVSTLTYTPRGWLKKKVTNVDGISETTSFDYDNVGQMTTITLPDNSSISYSFDDAHRLTRISDNLGNSINYTLDNMGNRINETVTDSSGRLTRQISRSFDVLGHLQKITGGAQ
ncbi:RHS repeat protein [Undibacterium hunanense]|uniref:RHS repeat protein n=1 Tax=Undibacterium hunanense TaxID=2762292 RepID=UPI00164BEDAF|nr:RHS repeat protein [Undibacterium hunanense]